MITAARLSFAVIVLQGCMILPKRWPEAIDRSPCFTYISTPIPIGDAVPSRSYLRLRNHASDLPGKSFEVYRDSTLTQAGRGGIWDSAGRDTLRLDFWIVPTTIVTLHRDGSDRWTGELTYGGDLVVNGKPLTWRAQIDLIPYRCPAPA